MTTDEVEYLEQLGFVPSAFSSGTFVRLAATSGIDAVVERIPFGHGGWTGWQARKPGMRQQDTVRSNDLTALIVMAKLEGIL